MYNNRPQNTTSIDELPDIDEIEGPQPYQPAIRNHLRNSKYPGAEMLPVGEEDKFQKYIRNGHTPSMESGMNPNPIPSPFDSNMNEYYEEDSNLPYQNQPNYNNNPSNLKLINMPEGSPSCIDVCQHLMNCPVCARLYNNDKTVYIIAIVILAFICILLLKKVLDV